MLRPGRDRVQDLHHFPLFLLLQHGALIEAAILPVETALLPWSAQPGQVGATFWSSDAGRCQGCALLNGAVAIHAIDLNGVAGFSVQFAIAVAVLLEVAVDAVHSLFQM